MTFRQFAKLLSGPVLSLAMAGAATLVSGQARPHARAGANSSSKAEDKSDGKSAVLSGRIFLITVAGDIKPARMAKIHLFSWNRGAAQAGNQGSVAERWNAELYVAREKASNDILKLVQDQSEAVEKGAGDPNFDETEKEFKCQSNLTAYVDALSKTLAWSMENDKGSQMVIDLADEEGNFKISVPRPGRYDIVVMGHAGFNDAVWSNEGVGNDLVLTSGKETVIKMSSPQVACVAKGD